jgi:hypothetical protein
MKTLFKSKLSTNPTESKHLTLGDLIASTYGAGGEKGVGKMLQLAMEAHIVRYAKPIYIIRG